MTTYTPLTAEERAEARRLVDAATPGPWLEREDHDYYQGGTYLGHGPLKFVGTGKDRTLVDCHPLEAEYFKIDVCQIVGSEADHNFIAASRTLVPKLLNALEAAERERDEARLDAADEKTVAAAIIARLDKALNERDAARARLAEVERERDEALTWKQEYEDMQAAFKRAMLERDVARAQVKTLAEALRRIGTYEASDEPETARAALKAAGVET